MRKSVVIFLFLAILLRISHCHAQVISGNFHRFSLDQGLSMNFINCIGQDRQGFIWVGTADGLNKYDGYKFTTYRNKPAVAGSISNNLILSVYVDKAGVLYVGTNDGGLNIYNREKDTFMALRHDPGNPASISSDRVNTIFEDHAGTLWIGTENGLDTFDRTTNTFTHYIREPANLNSLTCNMIRALAEDKSGNLWIGTENGLSILQANRKNFRHFHHQPGNPESLSRNAIRSLFIDSDEDIWIGTAFGGVNRFHKTTQSFSHLQYKPSDSNSIVGDYVAGICGDKEGNIWFATNFGVSVLDKRNKTLTSFQQDSYDDNSLVDNGLNTIFRDRDNNIWIGSIAGLTVKEAIPPKFEHVFHNPGNDQSLGNKDVYCFFEDKDKRIWIGLRLGFDLYNPKSKTFRHFTHFPDGQPIPTITSVYQDSHGDFWLGMYEGIARYNIEKGTVEMFSTANPEDSLSTPIRDIWYMQEDAKGELYISSYTKSLFKFNRAGNRFELFTWLDKKIQNIDPTSFYIDRQNNFWIGSERDGLLVINPEKNIYKRFKNDPELPNSISNNHILVIYEDEKGRLWAGTEGGLNLMDREKGSFVAFREEDGLPSNQINGIEEDAQGNLWISTNNGLSCFDTAGKKFRNYNIDDGLQHNEFRHRASARLSSGQMLFGGLDGFNIVDPSKIQINRQVPAVYITDFQIFNKPVTIGTENSPLSGSISETEEIVLSHRQSVLTFEFVALNYIVSRKNQYAYMMEGFEENWNYSGTQHKATYTNLDPGKYTFRVKASNNDGVWNETGTSLSIIINPPFYKTPVVKIMAAVLMLALLYAGFRIKTDRINKKNRRLEEGVQERTREIERQKQELAMNRDELKNLNLEISNQNEILERKVEERTQDLQATNEKLAASEEQLRNILDQTLRINQKLTESEARLAEAQQIARMGNLELNPETGLFTWSEETWRIFGVDRAAFLPSCENVLELIPPGFRDVFSDCFQGNHTTKESFNIEIQINKGINSPGWVLIIGKPVQDATGMVIKIVGIIIDITERKLAEEQLRFQNQELLRINAELDRFVYCASHDLRAPLSSLLGLINIFKIEPDEEARNRYLSLMQKSINKLDTFIQSIISYSKNSRLEISSQTVDFEELVKEAEETLQYMDRSKMVDIRLTTGGDSVFQSDVFRLKIIFNNLLSNAIRYSNPYVTSYVNILVKTEDQKAIIVISDNGCGIARENLNKVFDMFYRASETNVGSGLGLYIVKEVILALKGKIEIQSDLGKGTTVRIELPNLNQPDAALTSATGQQQQA